MKTNGLEVVQSKIQDLLSSHNKIFIAYSGGLDSHVLLHLCASLSDSKTKKNLTAIHVNHNLSSNAKKWSKHCQKTCEKLSIEYITRDIASGVASNGHSPEEILRKLRYEIFAQILPKDSCILTAHQADDQAETLLLQLFRGAGPKGLAAMPEKIKFAKGCLARPLLENFRKEILEYATNHKLKWIEDESNLNPKYDRNFVRHHVLPVIKKKWPSVTLALNRASKHCAEANELLEILAEKDLREVICEDRGNIINIELLKEFSFIRQKNILRYWLCKLSLPMPSEVKLNEVIRTVVNSKYDAVPVVKWFGAEIRRFRNNLYALSPLVPHDNKMVLSFSGKTLTLPDGSSVLKIKTASGAELDLKKIRVRFRQGGEKIRLPNRKGTHDLKKLMQEWDIPPWQRDRIPLIFYGSKIIAVVGYYSDGSVSCSLS